MVGDMCPNRVEELESRVQELEASVEGLTDELIECKVRIRELENATDADIGFVPASEKKGQTDSIEESVAEAEAASEETKAEGDNSTDNTEETDDIIIA